MDAQLLAQKVNASRRSTTHNEQPLQRDNLLDQLKPMPGHKAKLAAFFTVIDKIYPRQKIIEQIKACTPEQKQKNQKVRVWGGK